MEGNGVIMLRGILRNHGYTLEMEQLADKNVTKDSWKSGDWVKLLDDKGNMARIVVEGSSRGKVRNCEDSVFGCARSFRLDIDARTTATQF